MPDSAVAPETNGEAEEQVSLLSKISSHPSPATITKIIRRLRAMTLKLLPVQVETSQLIEPTSRIITPQVIAAYAKAAGDFTDCLPYCLLRARQSFMWDANSDAADYDENISRAVACEMLARKIVNKLPSEKLYTVMSDRLAFQEDDGDKSSFASALETAIDQHCTIFLSSSEAQTVVESIWRGEWVQQESEGQRIAYVQYKPERGSIWDWLDPSRLAVPRYQNWMRIVIWLFFLFVYSQAVQQPLEMTLDPRHPFDVWETFLYGMALAFTFEDMDKIYATLRLFTWRALGFWHFVSIFTDTLLITAFSFRIVGISLPNLDEAAQYKLKSFQILSCVAPLIWMKLITVVDGFKYIGTMQICVARMLKESGIFFVLFAVVGAGFVQSMYAIDASDGRTDRGLAVIHNLVQGLLGSPDFGNEENSVSLIIFYCWNIFTTIILLNVLISLFSSAYADVTDDAAANFLAFFASKTVAMIRAPDEFVYPAPFNLIEIFFIAPTEWVLSKKAYAKYNRVIMSVVFCLPLMIISLWEAQLSARSSKFMSQIFNTTEDGEEDDPHRRDPSTENEDGMEISKTPFEELVKVFPNTFQSPEATILIEIRNLSKRIDELSQQLERKGEA
ncbi:hypothetical protein FRB95_004527 [Tulasnella sp. JGI-2019a]|nr:hypothetical protein FRB95_004527 [Tulasnella sp. JGI-2019a]